MEKLIKEFKHLDTNGDGELTRDELITLFKDIGSDVNEEFIDDLILKADENQDGKI